MGQILKMKVKDPPRRHGYLGIGSHFVCTCTLGVCFPCDPLKCGYSLSFGNFLGFANLFSCRSLCMLSVLGILLKFSLNGGKGIGLFMLIWGLSQVKSSVFCYWYF